MDLSLLPVCQNTITWLRSTKLPRIIPFDDNIRFDKDKVIGNSPLWEIRFVMFHTIACLFCLQEGLKERELSVFFRNNHFNTMFKFNGELYLLATDQAYINQPDLVWEKLNEVNGDTVFMTGNFTEFKVDNQVRESWNEQNAMTSTADFLANFEASAAANSSANGSNSLNRNICASYVPEGILADEMGLGKTVELLACIFAHRVQSLEDNILFEDETKLIKSRIKRHKEERVECICGATSESSRYSGLWVQCDTCDVWQHADCVGYKPVVKARIQKKKRSTIDSEITELEDSFNCSLCLEHRPKTRTASTLIVYLAPILAQWHSEIMRHTRPGSLKVCIYEGARYIPNSVMLRNVTKDLENADIVLTTYDVLKEDLSHDSDQNGRVMRFKKDCMEMRVEQIHRQR